MKNIPLLFLILFILFLFFVVYSNYSKKKEPMDTEPDDTNNELISEVQQVLTQMSSDIYESVSSLVRIKTQEAEEAVETDLNELEDVVKTIGNEQNEDADEELDDLKNYINSELQKIEATAIANKETSRSGVSFEIDNDREKVISIVNKYINN